MPDNPTKQELLNITETLRQLYAHDLQKLNDYYSSDTVKVELVDMQNEWKELKRNKGIKQWIVWDKLMEDDKFYTKWDDVREERKRYVKETMFMPEYRAKCKKIKDKVDDYLKLERCMRFLPHFHDTGGFFVAVLRKNVINGKNGGRLVNFAKL